VNRPGPLTGKG